jgi:hypothetical protein
MKNSCGSCKHTRAVDGKQNLQFHWPNGTSNKIYKRLYCLRLKNIMTFQLHGK